MPDNTSDKDKEQSQATGSTYSGKKKAKRILK